MNNSASYQNLIYDEIEVGKGATVTRTLSLHRARQA
jgi:hypothetical protein